jgi:hypothetical protein
MKLTPAQYLCIRGLIEKEIEDIEQSWDKNASDDVKRQLIYRKTIASSLDDVVEELYLAQ